MAIWLLTTISACQQTATAPVEKCPLKEMGYSCPDNKGTCPTEKGLPPCNDCKTKAAELKEQQKSASNKTDQGCSACPSQNKCDGNKCAPPADDDATANAAQIEEKMQKLSQQWGMALQAEDYNKALTILKQMDETIPNNSNIKSSFAYTYALKGDYDKAIAIYNEMLKDFPDNPNLIGNIANVYTLKGDYDKAIGMYNKLLEKYPDEPSITDALACAYMKKGDYDKTLEIFNTLLESFPKNPGLLYNICCAYSLKGSKKEACESLNKSVECGYFDWKHMEKDTDLDNIRGEDAYKKTLETLKTKYPNGVNESEGCAGDCNTCPSNQNEAQPKEDHKHMHDGCDQCPDHDKCLKEGKCAGDCDKKMKGAKDKKCDGTCDHKDGKEDPKCSGDCEHKKDKK
jgi:tetratricopeptide (TPR) repeat protein